MLMPAMAFKATVKRYILAGDQAQLRVFVLTECAKTNWPAMFRGLIENKWPCTFLNRQYRMPEPLYEHAMKVIYPGSQMSHAKTMEDISDETKTMLGSMPLWFEAGSKEYFLTAYLNFVNVSDGVQEKAPDGSSS